MGLMNSLRHRTADDVVDEFVARPGRLRIQLDLGVTVLAAAAGLANVLAFGFGVLANGFAIRHLRLAHVRFDFVLAHHAVDDDFEMQLAHAADDGLSAVGVGVNLEGGIFLGQLGKRHAHFFLVGFGLGLDRDRNHGNREGNVLQSDGMLFVADGVAGRNVLQTDGSADIARQNFIDVFALVGVHLQQTADALAASAAGVEHRVAGFEVAGVDADKGQLADKRVSHDLERQRGKRFAVGRLAGDHFAVLRDSCP